MQLQQYRLAISSRKNNSILAFFILSLSLLSIKPLQGQMFVGKETTELAYNSIDKLKEGLLVVRLYTNHNALDTLYAMLARGSANKAGIRHKINQIKEVRDYENRMIIKAMKQEYQFSDIAFIPDYNYEAYLNGERKNICWNESLEETDMDLYTEPSLVLSRAQGANYDWAVILPQGQALDDPFPNFFKMNPTLIQFMKGAFQPKAKEPYEKYQALAAKINEKLSTFYATLH